MPLCLNSNAFVQVGAPGSIPDEVRQDIIAPLQDLPGILEVCGLKPNSLLQIGAQTEISTAPCYDMHEQQSRQMRQVAA